MRAKTINEQLSFEERLEKEIENIENDNSLDFYQKQKMIKNVYKEAKQYLEDEELENQERYNREQADLEDLFGFNDLDEAVGAGFSLQNKYPGSSRRGMGFGSSSVGSSSSPYTYSLMPLNHSLEPNPNNNDNSEKIHIGQLIRGKQINKGLTFYEGTIIDIKRSSNANILYYIIINSVNKKRIKIDPKTIQILNPKEVANPAELTSDSIENQFVKEGFYPEKVSYNPSVKEGDRVKCIYMDDISRVESGTEGTGMLIDSAGVIHVEWDNGRRLGLLRDVDKFIKINKTNETAGFKPNKINLNPTLKIGDKVKMLSVSTSDEYSSQMNGMTGIVVRFENGEPDVKWQNGRTLLILPQDVYIKIS